MMNRSRLMRRYLLGTATPTERTALENDYLASPETFHELTAAENDLIDSYTRGELSIPEKQAFESRYLTNVRGRSRVEFAQALADVTKEAALTASPREVHFLETILSVFRGSTSSEAWSLAAACAVVLLVGVISLRLLNHRGFNSAPSEASTQSDHQAIPVDRSRQSGAEASTGSPELLAKDGEHASQDFTVQIEPDLSRAIESSPQTLVVPIHTEWLSLQVVIEDDERRPLTAIIQTPEGNEVFRAVRSEVSASRRGKFLRVRIPTERVPAGDYILEVNAPAAGSEKEESVTSCSFRLTYK